MNPFDKIAAEAVRALNWLEFVTTQRLGLVKVKDRRAYVRHCVAEADQAGF